MSNHHLKEQVEAFTENSWLKLSNRVAGIIVFVIILPLMSWLGIQVWQEQRDQGTANAQAAVELHGKIAAAAKELQGQINSNAADLQSRLDGVKDQVAEVAQSQAVTAAQLLDALRRLDRLEMYQQQKHTRMTQPLPDGTTSTATQP